MSLFSARSTSLIHTCVVLAIPALSTAISGCGTMASITNATGDMPPKPFGGVLHDCDALAMGNFLGAFDLPGSFVGDVVTLPEVLVENAHCKRASVPQASELRPGRGKKAAASDDDE